MEMMVILVHCVNSLKCTFTFKNASARILGFKGFKFIDPLNLPRNKYNPEVRSLTSPGHIMEQIYVKIMNKIPPVQFFYSLFFSDFLSLGYTFVQPFEHASHLRSGDLTEEIVWILYGKG